MPKKHLYDRLVELASLLRVTGTDPWLEDLLDEAADELAVACHLLDAVDSVDAEIFIERHSDSPDAQALQEGIFEDCITESQLRILRHALTGGGVEVSRNHYFAGEGHEDFDDLGSLCVAGLMHRGKLVNDAASCGIYFHVTAAGCKAVGLQIPPDRFGDLMKPYRLAA